MNQVALESYASNSEITETKYINISRKHKQQNIQSQVQSVSEKNLTTMDDATFWQLIHLTEQTGESSTC